jgi:hypothetical protein
MATRWARIRRSCRTTTMYKTERETGLEPATLCLGSKCSTTELLPRSLPLVRIGEMLYRQASRVRSQRSCGSPRRVPPVRSTTELLPRRRPQFIRQATPTKARIGRLGTHPRLSPIGNGIPTHLGRDTFRTSATRRSSHVVVLASWNGTRVIRTFRKAKDSHRK